METGHGASINTRCGHFSKSVRTMDVGLKENQATINRVRSRGTNTAVSGLLVRTRDLMGLRKWTSSISSLSLSEWSNVLGNHSQEQTV